MQGFFTWLSSYFVNTLAWWQWLILGLVPPAIVALYFLKLKRRPLEVPSTYLWHKSVEDLHVNAIWQRLRRNLLLLLQLLLLLLLIFALLRPSWQERRLLGNRFIFLIDNSASMQATDVGPSRLEEAKSQVADLIDQMQSDDAAMIVSFSDKASIVQTFTSDRRLLKKSLESIAPTSRPTSLKQALYVASGLANPGRSSEDDRDYQVAEAMPAQLFIFSDGRFEKVTEFSLGNLNPTFVPIGTSEVPNVGVAALSVGQNEQRPEQFQAFVKLRNFGPADVTVEVDLLLDGRDFDHHRLAIPAGGAEGLTSDLGEVRSGVLQAVVTTEDNLACDNTAYAVISPPRKASVLLVSPGCQRLVDALTTGHASMMADVTVETPDFLSTKTYAQQARDRAYDLIVYDRCDWDSVPEGNHRMPQANTLFIGRLPPGDAWKGTPVGAAQIVDVEVTHPLFRLLDLSNVIFAEGMIVEPPPGGGVLGESDLGPILAIAPREGFEDAVLGFEFVSEVTADGNTQVYRNTNWPTLQSFPVFARNVLEYLGGRRNPMASGSVQLGSVVTLQAPAGEAEIEIHPPTCRCRACRPPGAPVAEAEIDIHPPPGKPTDLTADELGKCVFTGTSEVGVYEAQHNSQTFQQIAVNLFDKRESDVSVEPEPSIQVGYVEVVGEEAWTPWRRELWKVLVAAGLVVLLVEWYIYNRRVYL